ncbi:Hypothetical protein CKL_1737 [Clostridium kluyveri DSM 555]|uniref:Uncharacterized protein n=1 Tax=Clostridium kluyveri (strain ATCC 8527 / DSM 555 / NBRC 12016 / NCIMB 10680 / K1) TaxID=431943 RepID=A5N8Z8_CLOK5|nr:Hypothetical protein CKL_1737 [Clostridium kluyveri DSM 555]
MCKKDDESAIYIEDYNSDIVQNSISVLDHYILQESTVIAIIYHQANLKSI